MSTSELEHWYRRRPAWLRWAWWIPAESCGGCGWPWPCWGASRMPMVRWIGGYNTTSTAPAQPAQRARPANASYRTGWLRNGGTR